ncbi:MAG: hypothetical protein J5684_00720 [Eubacterium sp.]|nr:hypothetical protein [Eubacterium sp.]
MIKQKIVDLLKKDIMLSVSIIAAVASMFITPPSKELLKDIDWHTLGTLFMMLTVLEGFKQENVFRPIIMLSTKFKTMVAISLFLIFGVFFTSMFVTNDVSLIIFVPLTILLFRGGEREHYILPVISMENIAAIRGSLLMPFGSPQNLFLYSQSGTNAANFILHMSPLCIMSAILLIIFVTVLYRKNLKEDINIDGRKVAGEWTKEGKVCRISYILLFVMILLTIVSRTKYWPVAVVITIITVLIVSPKLFTKVDYVLLLTFFCFFIFSSSIVANAEISQFLMKAVAGREYWWGIGLSQLISNVPASIVLYPFSKNFAGLIYGADTAGLCSLIGSLASVINYRIYVREYPGKGKDFVKTFTLICWAFFIIVVIPGWLLSHWAFF